MVKSIACLSALLLISPACPASEIPPPLERLAAAPAEGVRDLDPVERAELARTDPAQKGGRLSHDERLVIGVFLILVAILAIA